MNFIPEVGTVCGIPLVGTKTGPANVRFGRTEAGRRKIQVKARFRPLRSLSFADC
jgi:hypothetical protein